MDVYPAIHFFKKDKTDLPLRLFRPGADAGTSKVCNFEGLEIYHYPNCGFEQYLNKYRTLGKFWNYSFKDKKLKKYGFHVWSRDAYISGDLKKFKQLYKDHVQFSDLKGIKSLIEAGYFEQNKKMSRIIKRALAKFQKRVA
jgi:hypothetical protein